MKQLSQIAISFLVIASMLTGMDKPSLSLEKLIENNARQLRIFVAKEQRGTYCPELYKAQELLKPYACEIENQPWTPLGAFICNIVDKSGYYNKLISILKHEHPHDIPHMCRQLLKENRYAINIYGSAQPYEDRIITPLHYALAMHAPRELQESTLVFCKTLLSLGANPNARDDAGNTPLHHASTVEQVQLLCDYGAKLNKKGESGRTPLLNSIRLRNWKVAQCLLEYGANPHKKDKNNNSPFYKALKKKADPAFIQLLLNKDVNCIICRKGKTIADLADAKIYADKLLPDFCPLSFCNILLHSGANPNARDDAGNTPMHHASTPEQVRLLCEYGAKLNTKGDGGRTPLLNDIRLRNWPVVKCLLQHGANPNIRDDKGTSPLRLAIKKNKPKIVKLLLDSGADWSLETFSGFCPIYIYDHIIAHRIEKDLKELLQKNDVETIKQLIHTPCIQEMELDNDQLIAWTKRECIDTAGILFPAADILIKHFEERENFHHLQFINNFADIMEKFHLEFMKNLDHIVENLDRLNK